MSVEENLHRVLADAGTKPRVLDRKEVWYWQKTWRASFASKLHLATGKWVLRGIDWHVLNSNYHDSTSKERAIEDYGAVSPGSFVVFSDGIGRDFGFSCHGQPPVLRVGGVDILVMDESATWTMAFTHSPDYGPFFSEVEDGESQGALK